MNKSVHANGTCILKNERKPYEKDFNVCGNVAVIFVLAACGNGVQKKTSEKYSVAEVEQAGQVMKYYNTSLALLKNLVLEKDVNSILGYMEQGGNAPMLATVIPPVFSQKDSASVVNPGTYFDEEARRNLKQNFMQLFQTRRQFYTNFNQYLSLLKVKNKIAADKLLPANYRLSVEMAEYKENILDVLSPFAEGAQKVLLNDNPMKEQILAMNRMSVTMQGVLQQCMRKPAPDMPRLDMKMMKLVIQLDIAKRLPIVEGHPQEMKTFRDFLANAETFIREVQHIKAQGSYTADELATLGEYGLSLN